MVMVLPTNLTFSGMPPFLLALAEACIKEWHTHSNILTLPKGNQEKYLMQ